MNTGQGGESRFLLLPDKKYLSRVSYARTLAGTRFVHQSVGEVVTPPLPVSSFMRIIILAVRHWKAFLGRRIERGGGKGIALGRLGWGIVSYL